MQWLVRFRIISARLIRQPHTYEYVEQAFSGGGVRAAAFQAGVLWHLAESGHLKERGEREREREREIRG